MLAVYRGHIGGIRRVAIVGAWSHGRKPFDGRALFAISTAYLTRTLVRILTCVSTDVSGSL